MVLTGFVLVRCRDLLATGFWLSVLAFFGIFSLFPVMLMIFGEGNTFLLGLSILVISLPISLFLVSSRGQANPWLVDTIAGAGILVVLGILVVNAFTFTSLVSEPWMTQVGWFIRYHGIVIGALLALATLRGMSGMARITADLPWDPRGRAAAAGIVTALLAGFLAGLTWILVTWNVPGVMIAMGCVTVVLAIWDQVARVPEGPRVVTGGATPAATRDGRLLLGTLVVMAMISATALVSFPLDATVHVSMDFQGQNLTHDLSLAQLATLGVLLAGFLVLPFMAGRRVARERLGLGVVRGWKAVGSRFVVASLDGIKVIALLVVASQVIYFYDYELFFPVIVPVLACAAAGACAHAVAARSGAGRAVVLLAGAIVVIATTWLVHADAIHHAYNHNSPEFDTIFTYAFLFSPAWVVATGLGTGILLSEVILSVGFDKPASHASGAARGALLAVCVLVGAFLVMPFNYLMDSPGGDVGSTAQLDPASFEGSTFHVMVIAITVLLVLAVVATAASAAIARAFTRATAPPPSSHAGTSRHAARDAGPVLPSPRARKAIGLAVIAGIALLATAGGIAGYLGGRARPVLVHRPGQFHAWLASSTERVAPHESIALPSSPVIAGAALTLARNEYGAFQVVFSLASAPINDVSLTVSDLEHEDGASPPLSGSAWTVRKVGRVLGDLYHDVLVPFTVVDLVPGSNHVFHFSTRTPANATPGAYTGAVRVASGPDTIATFAIRVEIWNFTVPVTRHLRANIGGHSSDIALIDNYNFHRINDYGHGVAASLNPATNEWTFTWDTFDALVQYKLDGGMNAFTVPYYLEGRDPDIDNPVEMLRMKNYLAGIQHHLDGKNWTRYAYIYFIDEFQMFVPPQYTRDQYFARLATLLAAMKEAAPGLRVMTTTPPSAELHVLRDYIDVFCPVTYDYDQGRWEERQRTGAEFWMYPCVQPFAPWPNSHLYNRLYECRVLLWQAWHYRIDGFLYWSSMAYYHGKNGMGYNGYGDGWFIHIVNGTYLDSLRWENYLDGQEDYEYLWLANATLAEVERQGLLSPDAIARRRDELARVILSVTGDKWRYTDDPATVHDARAIVGTIIHELSALVATDPIGEAPWLGYL